MPMFYSSLNSRFNLFSIETNINRKKEAHHKLVFLWNHWTHDSLITLKIGCYMKTLHFKKKKMDLKIQISKFHCIVSSFTYPLALPPPSPKRIPWNSTLEDWMSNTIFSSYNKSSIMHCTSNLQIPIQNNNNNNLKFTKKLTSANLTNSNSQVVFHIYLLMHNSKLVFPRLLNLGTLSTHHHH
jgi:hypothetical protein